VSREWMVLCIGMLVVVVLGMVFSRGGIGDGGVQGS
jgi:hypothetical protein